MLEQLRIFIEVGGPIVALLLIVSVFAFALALFKVAQFVLDGVGSGLQQMPDARVGEKPRQGASAKLFYSISDIAHDSTISADQRDELIRSQAEYTLIKHSRGLRLLGTIEHLAPLLGLLGTVVGMIRAFQAIEGSVGALNSAQLAGGVWIALLTTGLGLFIAIVLSMVLNWLENRLEIERVRIRAMCVLGQLRAAKTLAPLASQDLSSSAASNVSSRDE